MSGQNSQVFEWIHNEALDNMRKLNPHRTKPVGLERTMFGRDRTACCLVRLINTSRPSMDRSWHGSICAATRDTVPTGSGAHI